MADIITLHQALSSANSFRKYVLNGDMGRAVGELHIHAAKEAFDRLPYVNNKTAQVRSALNHLEVADTALKPRMKLLTSSNEALKRKARGSVIKSEVLCALFIQEPKLVEKLLSDLKENDETACYWSPESGKERDHDMVGMLINLANFGIQKTIEVFQDTSIFETVSSEEFSKKVMAMKP